MAEGSMPLPLHGYGYHPYAAAMQQYQAAAAYQRAAMQYQYSQSMSEAAMHAGQSHLLDSMAADTKGRGSKPLTADQKDSLMRQIEFYSSDENMCKDLYLRSHMDANGWMSLDLIAHFNKVRKYGVTAEAIAKALKGSSVLELNMANLQVRLRDPARRARWTKAPQGEAGGEAGAPKPRAAR